jgi:hypothetical protein
MQRDHEYIQVLAYRIWEARGRPEGSADQDWREAERQLAAADAAGFTGVEAPQATNASKPKIRAATTGSPAMPRARPTLRTSAPITDSDHASKKQEPGWPGSS